MPPADALSIPILHDQLAGLGHIVTLVLPRFGCTCAASGYTVGNPPRRPGSPAQAGLFVALFVPRP